MYYSIRHIALNSKCLLVSVLIVLCSCTLSHAQLSSHVNADQIKVIENLVDSREYVTVNTMARSLIDSSFITQDTDQYAWGLYFLSIVKYNRDDIDSAIYYSQHSYKKFVESENFVGQCKALCLLGSAYYFKPNYDSSIVVLNKSIDIALNEVKDSLLAAEPYHGLGKDYTLTGEHNKAMEYLLKSLHLYQKASNQVKEATVLNSTGVLLKHRGDFHNALEFYYKALEIFEETKDFQGISYQHNNIGLVLNELKDYNNALDHLSKSLTIKNTTNDRRGISNTLMNMGAVYMNCNKYENALSYFNQAEVIKEQIKDFSGLASIYQYKGDTYQKIGLYNKSIQMLTLSAQTYANANETKGTANAKILLAITYYKMGQYNKAFQLLDEATKMLGNNDMSDLTALIYKTYYDIYNSINDCKNSLLFYQKYIAIRDSISSIDNLKKILSLQMRMEYNNIIKQHSERSNYKLQEAEKDSSINARIAIFFIVAFLSAIIILILFFYTLKNKQKINEELGNKQVEIEEQKQELIIQRDDLEIQKNLVIYQRDRIINMLTDLGESIDYAKKIQQAILPSNKIMSECFRDYFIINQPKDSVGGDFYWSGITNNNHVVFVAADSTGHGVPGGFMSMLCISMIIEIVARNVCQTPSDALDELRKNIISTLGQHGGDNDNTDGMDIAFCVYRPEEHRLYYAGANLSILIATKQKLILNDRITEYAEGLYEIKPDRMPISYFDPMRPFSDVEININPDDTIYLFSDGYTDQFGGESGKKFGHTAFRNLVYSIKDFPIIQQKQILWTTIEKWKGETENQTDDILLLGLQLK